MTNRTKLALGAVLASVGGIGIVLSLILDWTSLFRLWSFLVGFGFGLAAGIGVPLAISGLCAQRKKYE